MSLSNVRNDFPILNRVVKAHPLVYLDSAASSQKPQVVIDAISNYYSSHHSNVHRGNHTLSNEASELYEDARREMAGFIGASNPDEIVFTRGCTEAINLVASSWGGHNLTPGDVVLLTEMEHHSNIVPWQIIAKRTGAELRYIPVTQAGELDLTNLSELLDGRVKLVSFVHVSNTLGTVNPVAELVEAARSAGSLVLLDAAQSVPHLPVNVQELGIDFLTLSGHKMCGPTGIGCLWARRELLEEMPPYHGGGSMIMKVTLDGFKSADVPLKFEAGTPAIAGAVGLAAAARYLAAIGMEQIRSHDQQLVDYALDAVSKVDGLTVYGPKTGRCGSIAFVLDTVPAHDLGTILDAYGVAIRTGNHCTEPLHDRLGIAQTSRASFYLYNTNEDIDALIEGIKAAEAIFRRPHA